MSASWQHCLCSGVKKYHSLWSLVFAVLLLLPALLAHVGGEILCMSFCQGEAIMFTRTKTAVAELYLSYSHTLSLGVYRSLHVSFSMDIDSTCVCEFVWLKRIRGEIEHVKCMHCILYLKSANYFVCVFLLMIVHARTHTQNLLIYFRFQHDFIGTFSCTLAPVIPFKSICMYVCV